MIKPGDMFLYNPCGAGYFQLCIILERVTEKNIKKYLLKWEWLTIMDYLKTNKQKAWILYDFVEKRFDWETESQLNSPIIYEKINKGKGEQNEPRQP